MDVRLRHPLVREALLSALAAASVAALLAWLGPPGSDLAAHAYQRTLFLQHGFTLWNNFWYAGRYSFVSYSVLYYPLAALLGIRLLAVATIALAALAFAVVLWREWGPATRWSSRTFAVVWAGIVLSAAFPFALGIAFALLAIWTLQAGARWRFAAFAALTLAASAVAFLLLVVVLAGVALARRTSLPRDWLPVTTIALAALTELVLWRLFPGGGRYPFSLAEAGVAVAFCVVGLVFTWHVESARVLRFVFAVYFAACLVSYLVPSALGENVARLRYAAVPLAVLVFSLRRWRPRLVGIAIVTADIPLARGWFRQDDFPQNEVLYSKLGRPAYLHWLRALGVRYVVLAHAPPDYSSRGEAALVRSGRAGLRPVFHSRLLTIYAVPRPRPIVTGPGSPALLALTQSRIAVRTHRGGTYRIAVRWTPYWHTSGGCLRKSKDGMLRLWTRRARHVQIVFRVDASSALRQLAGQRGRCALGGR